MSIKFISAEQITHDTESCFRNLNLLAHAQIIELDIGSLCGGHGKCGKDLIQLSGAMQSKVNPPTAIEIHQLSTEQIQNGFRLACQTYPNQNDDSITVNLPV
jgi:ferredoxin